MNTTNPYLQETFYSPQKPQNMRLRDMDPNGHETTQGGVFDAPKNYKAEGEIDFFKPRKDYHRRANILTFLCCGLLIALIAISAAFGVEKQKASANIKKNTSPNQESCLTISPSPSLTLPTSTQTTTILSDTTIPITITATQTTTDPPVTVVSSVKVTPAMEVTVTCSTNQFIWSDLLRCSYGGRCTTVIGKRDVGVAPEATAG